MRDETEQLLREPSTELVFGLVAPVGADLEQLEADLIDQLALYGYKPNVIRLSALLRDVQDLGVPLKETPEFERITSYMDAGNKLRERAKAEEIMALWGLAHIHQMRTPEQPVFRRTAHVIRSIKHPSEARALRAVYGPGFYLIGLSASTGQKVKYLKHNGLTDAAGHRAHPARRQRSESLWAADPRGVRACRCVHSPAHRAPQYRPPAGALPASGVRRGRRDADARRACDVPGLRIVAALG